MLLTGEQISQQQAIYRQITHLTVRLLVLSLKSMAIDALLKASFDTLLRLQEVNRYCTLVAVLAHDQIEIPCGEGQIGIRYVTAE